ncbi:hypothetical protein [Arthrobacter sulfonylureivorans]|uniref:Ketohydroxyglutarate aldolase n=1 Tax=Arthrobacter sulfonylureivorans TaxID=2486855 RepID=A0ABY3W2J1_9MICC|nr:hypothetical protein [Arthrobacter sulfonylureivorans]UNK44264.1 hypothetical protein MNQ99_09580 [Arthrobacter sulfonylureivorans]
MHIIVTVRHERISDTGRIAEQLAAQGMKIEGVLSTVGVITGSVKAEELMAVRKIDGVESIDEDRSMGLPPPNSDVQ